MGRGSAAVGVRPVGVRGCGSVGSPVSPGSGPVSISSSLGGGGVGCVSSRAGFDRIGRVSSIAILDYSTGVGGVKEMELVIAHISKRAP
jgi:hypothetical protein